MQNPEQIEFNPNFFCSVNVTVHDIILQAVHEGGCFCHLFMHDLLLSVN